MRYVVSVTVLAFALAGCGGGDEPGATAETVTETVTAQPAPAETVTVTSTPSAEPTPDSPKLGDTQQTPFGTVTVKKVDPNVTTEPPDSIASLGSEAWAAALVRTCVDKSYVDEALKLSWGPWTVEDRQGGVFPFVDATGGINYPQPVYPQSGYRTTRPGTCVEGWITFGISAGAKIANVVYEGADIPEPLVWAI